MRLTSNDSTDSFSKLGIIIWVLASFFFLYEFFLRAFVGTLAPQIMQDLVLTPEKFALLSSAFSLAYAVMQVPVGILTDKLGVRKIMLFAILLCVISVFLFSSASNFSQAFISRVLMGFGSSFAFVCLLVIASTQFPRRYFGIFIGASQFIGTTGPLLAGGPLAQLLTHSHYSWNKLLQFIGIGGLVLVGFVFLFVRDKAREKGGGFIFLTTKMSVIMHLKSLMKNPQAWYIAIYSACIYVALELLGAVWGTSYLQSCGLSQALAAQVISMAWLGYGIGCLAHGTLSDLIKRRRPILIGSALVGLLMTGGITYLPPQSPLVYAFMFFMLGVAAGGQSIAFAAISEHVDLATKATALGFNNGVITLFISLAPLITAFLISTFGSAVGTHFSPQDFTVGFSIMPAMYIFSLLISLFLIRETFCKPQKEFVVLKV